MTKINNNNFSINNVSIANYQSPYLIAEISGNHKGDKKRIFQLITAAKKAGFSAVKIQYFTADDMTIDSENDDFTVLSGMWKGRSLYSLYQEGSVKKEWLVDIFSFAKKQGITLFSSVFSINSIALLEKLDCPAYKIASFEAMDIPLITAVAKTGKPLIVSTGIIDQCGINDVIQACESVGNMQLCFLHCISNYPAQYHEFNLATISEMMSLYPYPIGLSDHSLDNMATIGAISLGACVVEKHITVDRDDGAIDSLFSIPIAELASFCQTVENAAKLLGNPSYTSSSPRKNYRSLYVVNDIKKGDAFTTVNIKSIRPGHGIAPKFYPDILGKKATKNITKATALTWDLISQQQNIEKD
jgi:pseudaminic acid synthase